MSQETVVLNLPKDLGDCLLCTPAIMAFLVHYTVRNTNIVVIGSKRSLDWVETLANVKLKWCDPAVTPVTDAKLLLNLNFYDDPAIEKFFNGVPLYQPERMKVITEDGPDFGTGAVVGKKHVTALLEDCLTDMGILTAGKKLPVPELPVAFLEQKAVDAALAKFGIEGKYAVIIPVCAANRPLKRWEPEKFSYILQRLGEQNITPVLVGGPSDEEKKLCADIIAQSGVTSKDICGQTSLGEIAALAKGAVFTLGCDTGPTHIAAASGAPVFAFFGYYNDSNTWRPVSKGNTAHVLQGPTVQKLQAEDVFKTIQDTLAAPAKKDAAPKPPASGL